MSRVSPTAVFVHPAGCGSPETLAPLTAGENRSKQPSECRGGIWFACTETFGDATDMSHDWTDRKREVAGLREQKDQGAFQRLGELLHDEDLLVCIEAADALLDGWHADGLRLVLLAASQSDQQMKATLWGVIHERADANPGELGSWISVLRATATKELSVALARYAAAPW